MVAYIGRRIGFAVVSVFGVVVITFFLARVVPADPARLYAGGERASPAAIAQARAQLGLDRPLWQQFVTYVENVAHGDFGTSFVTSRSVLTDIGTFLPATLELVIPAILLALIFGIPVGAIAGARRTRMFDTITRITSISGAAVPAFWTALLLQLLFAVSLKWLPVGGENGIAIAVSHPIRHITGFVVLDAALAGNWSGVTDTLTHMVMPVVVLAIYPWSIVVRQTRASVIEVMTELHVTAARAAGFSESRILFRHVLKNAFAPTLTVLGLIFAGSLTGAVLIEVVFSWPGIGRYLTTAILSADFPAILAVTIIGAIGYVVINLIVDVVQVILDPRVRVR